MKPSISKTTLTEIAAQAGVHLSTASRALAGDKRISQATVRRVRRLAQKLDYRPIAAAKTMATNRSRQIGVLLLNTLDRERRFHYRAVFEIILGINERLEYSDYMLSIIRVADVRQAMESRVFRERVLDGMIVIDDLPKSIESKANELMPSCIWVESNHWKPTRCIRRDEVEVGRQVARHVLDLGYRRLLWVGPSEGATVHFSLAGRLAGLREVLATRPDVELISLPVNNWNMMVDYAPKLRSMITPDIGVIAYDMPAARMFKEVTAGLGLRLGFDVGLVCCDGDIDAFSFWRGLSRMEFDRFGLGCEAAEMMLATVGDQAESPASRTVVGKWFAGNTAWGPGSFTDR